MRSLLQNCYKKDRMASILKIGDSWRAQVRKKGFPTETQSFPTKAQAKAWADKIEADMTARKYQDVRILSNVTLGKLIERYSAEIGKSRPFGKNKAAVLKNLKIALGDV